MFCFIKIFYNCGAVDIIARPVSGAAGQGRRGEIQTRQASDCISPRRPCPAAPWLLMNSSKKTDKRPLLGGAAPMGPLA